jgi:3'-phosphoadenosine 5'-phosphosulfate sulfotransferase (PAPS reductase)/FAD synthetase
MLWRVLQSNNGLPPEAIVCFANTGKEEEATLRFVRDCGLNWNVPITWVEYRNDQQGYAVVDFETASRNGEPFEAIIKKRNYLPNPIARFCTVELKILTIERFLKHDGWNEWDSMIGVRADEQRRVAKMRADPKGGRGSTTRTLPLADAGIDSAAVGEFWKASPFDLELPNRNGKTMHGNCDLCFLKGANQVATLIAEKPSRATWWARMEGSITNAKIVNGGRFRSDRPSYAAMLKNATDQADAFGFDPEESGIEWFCGD